MCWDRCFFLLDGRCLSLLLPLPFCRGKLEEYMQLLVDSFNPAAAEGIMCRDTISVGWDGR